MPIISEDVVLKDCDVIQVLSKTNVVVYGTGADAKLFCDRYENVMDIKRFITSTSNDEVFRGKFVYSAKKFTLSENNEVVIICSRKYADEMSDILSQKGLKAGKDYWIWDPDYTDAIKAFVDNESRNLYSYKGENVVLIPLEGAHDGTEILYKYCIAHFCKKYQAHPVGYIRQAGNKFEPTIFPSTIDVYSAIGVDEIIDVYVDKCAVKEEFNNIINTIGSMDDWQNIKIAGMKCGISFLRDYLRLSELSCQPRSQEIMNCLKYAIKTVLFWKEYFSKHNVKTVILWDGVHNESYLRDIAINRCISTYIIHPLAVSKPFINFSYSLNFSNLKNFFKELSPSEQKIGIKWAKRAIEKTHNGDKGIFLAYRGNDSNLFASKECLNLPENNDGVKVLICPHVFDEDQWLNGNQFCGNNYISWLEFLGNISDITPYAWYIKMHPDETQRGISYIKEYTQRYSKIKLIETQCSPLMLKKKGFRYAITIAGSIGHEYPLLGINVINSGSNPHMSFDFNINPKSKKELQDILLNISNYSALGNIDQIYEYYALYYLYYRENDFSDEIRSIFRNLNFYKKDGEHTIYKTYTDIYSNGVSEHMIQENVIKALDEMNLWRPGVFYRKSNVEIENLMKSVMN